MTQYQSIYRKWRPRFFEDIIGQEHITRTLRNAIKLNRIAHAYLFSGPRGVGKTTTARILAKALNCQEGPTEHPCNQCRQCIRINGGQSMDVAEIDGASNRGIDEIRELRSKIGFAPVEGKYKVYIIDEVHMLTNEAFNALLKTLEEPPSQVLFIFATTVPQKVPKTILSRCQCFHFRRISVNEIVTKLKKITEEEKLSIDIPSLRLIAESATGSLRDAESILDQVVTFSEKKVTDEDVKEILGIIPKKLFFNFIQAIAVRDTKEALVFVGQLVKEGIDLHQFVQDMIVYTHQLSLIKILGKNSYSGSFFEEGDSEQILKLSEKIDLKMILDIIEAFNQIEDKIKYHRYPWILLELLIVRVTQIEKQNQEAKNDHIIIEKEKVDRQVNDSGQKIEKIKKENFSKSENKLNNVDEKRYQFDELWPKVLSRIKDERISLYAFLMANTTVYMKDDQLIVGFRQDCLFHKESLEKRENREKVESILKEEAKFEIKLKCFVDENRGEESVHFDLDNNKDTIKNEYSVNHKPVKRGKQIKNAKEDDSSTAEILEKARDLFGGNISED